jgi:hypothetical protein
MHTNLGWIVLGTLIFYLLSVPASFLLPLPTLFAWMVPILAWRTLAQNARRQALLLVVIGLVALFFSACNGIVLNWKDIFAINLPLLAMFVAVSFLTLTNPATEDPFLPKGKAAVLSTAVGTHLLGAVINLSVLFVFGDRLKRNGALRKEQLVVLGRTFTAAAWWSPFFVATGVALTYAPEMHWKETLVPGAIMSIIGVSYTIVEICFFRKKTFFGYPLKKESLAVPLFLAAIVILVHYQWHQLSVLLLICILAPLGTFVFMKGRPRGATIRDFVANKISSVSSPFALFLAAGVFSSGIKSITYVYPGLFSFDNMELSPMVFALLAGIMIIVGIIGVHPVVSIAVVSPLLLPLNPDHSQLGFLFLTSWAISTCSSPLSGVGLVLVSRFNAQPKQIIKDNFLYAVVMWAIATQINIIFF